MRDLLYHIIYIYFISTQCLFNMVNYSKDYLLTILVFCRDRYNDTERYAVTQIKCLNTVFDHLLKNEKMSIVSIQKT